MRQIVFLLPIFISIFAKSQDVASNELKESSIAGIQWSKQLSWKQVQKIAKKKNKFIFLDCYTTWCTPCKKMEREVFNKADAGTFFNEHFISVRLQMDKTKGDNTDVRNWYSTVNALSKKYGIPGYPTFLFFSPEGKLIYREIGYKDSKMLVNIGKKVLDPNVIYPYRIYYSLLAKYQNGIKDYRTMASLADTAKLLNQNDIAMTISQEYRSYLLTRQDEWLSPKNLVFMANFLEGSKDLFFRVFYENQEKVDSILQRQGFSKHVINNVIQNEELGPAIKQLKRSESKSVDSMHSEPDWEQLKQQIALKYTLNYAERNILISRVQWYKDRHEWDQCAKYLTMYNRKYKDVFFDSQLEILLNSTCWNAIFKRSVDKEQIDAAIECMNNMLLQLDKKIKIPPSFLDTYANLLYKAGRIDEAIRTEEDAFKKDNRESFSNSIDRMKKGKPTWPRYISSAYFDEGLID